MWSIHKFKVYFMFFYIFGLTSYIPTKKKRIKLLHVVSIFIKITHILTLSAYTIRFINGRSERLTSFNFDGIYPICVFFYSIIISVFAMYISISNSNVSRHICNRFAIIIQRMELKFQITIPMNRFNRNFAMTVFVKIATVLPSMLLLSKILEHLSVHLMLVDKMLCLINHVGLISLSFYIAFHISFIEFLMILINNQLQIFYVLKQYTKVSTVLYHLKFIHFNLWQISQIINKHFGILIAMLLLQLLHLFVFNIYQTFIEWPNPLLVFSK